MMSMGLVKRVLGEYFMFVQCYVVKELKDLEKYNRFITLVNTGKNGLHYVVIEKIDEKYVYYYDPLFVFKRRKKKDKFIRKWSKYCCVYA